MDNEILAARVNALAMAWTNQMDSIWRVHKYASTLQAGTIAGVWYLVDNHSYLLSILSLLCVNILLFSMYFISHRHSQIQKNFRGQLLKLEILERGAERPYASTLMPIELYTPDWAKLVLLFLSFLNSIAAGLIVILFNFHNVEKIIALLALVFSLFSTGYLAVTTFKLLKSKFI